MKKVSRAQVLVDIPHQEALCDTISQFQIRTTHDMDPLMLTLDYYESRAEVLSQYWNTFLTRHQTLEDWSRELDQTDYFKNDIFGTCERAYSLAMAFLRGEIRRLTPPAQTPTLQRSSSEATSSYIPKLNIPKFKGEQDTWESFRELFETSVIRDVNVPPVRKLQYLLTLLEGPAASVLKGTKITAANFEVAWEKLTRRFDNEEVRLHAHLEALINCEQITKKSAAGLGRLIDVAEEAFKGLKDLACPVEHYDIWFVHLVVRRLDWETKESWNIHREGAESRPTYQELITFLEARAHSLEQTYVSREKTQRGPDSRDVSHFSRRTENFGRRVNAMMTGTADRASSCPLCSASHGIFRCTRFLSLNSKNRKAEAAKLKLCFNCLKSSHPSKCLWQQK